MTIPTREDININNSPDEILAVEHFLGKNLSEAEKLFSQNPLYYQEDLMWMGVGAFRFYIQAAISYIQREAADNDYDTINCLAGILEFRLKHEYQELRPTAGMLTTFCRYILNHLDKFDAEIYDDLQARYILLHQSFEQFEQEDPVPLNGLRRP